jgi:hypothetical protein
MDPILVLLITVIEYMQSSRSCKNLSNFKIFQNLNLYKIFLSLNIKLYVVFVLLPHIIGCPSPGVRCFIYVMEAIHDNAISF